MTMITDEMLEAAKLDTAVAPDIVFGAQAALLARGVFDVDRLIPALLAAAWTCHKELHGEENKAAFAGLLRGWADSIDAMTAMN